MRIHKWTCALFEPAHLIIGSKRYAVNPQDEIECSADGTLVRINGVEGVPQEWRISEANENKEVKD